MNEKKKISDIHYQWEKPYRHIWKILDVGDTLLGKKLKEPLYAVRHNGLVYEMPLSKILDRIKFSESNNMVDVYRFLEYNENDRLFYPKCGFYDETSEIYRYFSNQSKMDFWIEINKENLKKESYELYYSRKPIKTNKKK